MNSLHSFDIQYLKGIGPARAQLLAKYLDIHNGYDLIRHFPINYVDRSNIYRIADFAGEMPAVQLRGRFLNFRIAGEGAKRRLVGTFSDGSSIMEILWFQGINKIKDAYRTGNEYIVFGKPTFFAKTATWSMSHPEVDAPGSAYATDGLRGVYSIPEPMRRRGITSRVIAGWMRTLLAAHPKLEDPMPPSTLQNLKLMDLRTALVNLHTPTNADDLRAARLRLKFDELFTIQVDMQLNARRRKFVSQGARFPVIGRYFNRFYHECLPFQLTDAQKRVVREIRADVNTGHQMNRLVQGDVGSGKTIVALMAMLMALDNGYQACIMAPTEILATQHYESLRGLVASIGVNIELLTGSTGAKHRREIHAQLADGSLHILVGTHALIEDNVAFRNLGMAVIDEQHRFGVAQRAKLWTKNERPPHVLVMTATPIPRTLAMTLYGDLDVSVLDELPPGRHPIKTVHVYNQRKAGLYDSVRAELRAGRQVYWAFPLIKESEKSDLLSLEQGFEALRQVFAEFRVAKLHGQMKSAEKEAVMRDFQSGRTQVLVSTTVIEVGVDVPNASVMVIEEAQRFGLSQLHQLRGRVGRGAEQSYCVLITPYAMSEATRRRIAIMVETTDGFRIAEEDLNLRGPGDLEGTQQSGLPFELKVANLARDGVLLAHAREVAQAIVEADPTASRPENALLWQQLRALRRNQVNWSAIS